MFKSSNFFKALKCFCLIIFQISTVSCKSEARIVDGNTTTIDKAPYLVQLYKKGIFSCSGTLVSDQFVVTAAHCVKGTPPDYITVVGGASKLLDTGIRSKVSKVMVPKSYKRNTYHSDVAVIKLATPLTGASVQTTKLCKNAWKHGDPVQIFGWGSTYESADFIPLELQTVIVNVIDKEICLNMYRNRIRLTETMFCAAAPGKDTCGGDSGGPAFVNGEFCGIVSWGIGCARSDSPGIYTSVLETLPFIQNAMQQ